MNQFNSFWTFSMATFVLGVLLMVSNAQAQTPSFPPPPPPPVSMGFEAPPPPPNEVTLIPYNDRGKWGYCDTLGNLVYKPTFQEASFFYPIMLGGQRKQMANVITKWGENRMLVSGELLLPRKMDYQRSFYSKTTSNTTFLVREKGKYGIYELNKGMIVPAEYDSLCTPCHSSSWTLLKQKGEDTYRRYNSETLELETEQYVSLECYRHPYDKIDVATTADGRHYRLRGNKLEQITEEELATYIPEEEFLISRGADNDRVIYSESPPPDLVRKMGK
jgi:hypothetical protein